MPIPPWTKANSGRATWTRQDRKSTRLNSSHGYISYAVFCLKKKKKDTRSKAEMKSQTVTSMGQNEAEDSKMSRPLVNTYGDRAAAVYREWACQLRVKYFCS